jgi:hypothetical protein
MLLVSLALGGIAGALAFPMAAQETPGTGIIADGSTANGTLTAGGTFYTSSFLASNGGIIYGLENTLFQPTAPGSNVVLADSGSQIHLDDNTSIDFGQNGSTSSSNNTIGLYANGNDSRITVGNGLRIGSGGSAGPTWGLYTGGYTTTATIDVGDNAIIAVTDASGSYAVRADGGKITFGNNAHLTGFNGSYIANSAVADFGTNATIASSDPAGYAIASRDSTITAINASIIGGRIGINLQLNAEARLTGGSITTTTDMGEAGATDFGAVAIVGANNTSTVVLTDVDINAIGLAISIRDDNANNSLTIQGGTISGQRLIATSLFSTGSSKVTFENTDLSAAGDILVDTTGAMSMSVSVVGGTGLNGNVVVSGAGELDLSLKGSSLAGNITNLGTGALDVSIADSAWTSIGSSNLDNLTLDNATLALELTSLADKITVAGDLTLKEEKTSIVTVLLGNGILENIIKEGETGMIELEVSSLITGSSELPGTGDLEYVLTGTRKNSAGSTYTVTHLEGNFYEVGNINYTAIPEPAIFAVLAGLALLACAVGLRRRAARG